MAIFVSKQSKVELLISAIFLYFKLPRGIAVQEQKNIPICSKQALKTDCNFLVNFRVILSQFPGLEITAGQRTMSGPAGTKHRSQVIVLPIQKVSQTPLKANLRPN